MNRKFDGKVTILGAEGSLYSTFGFGKSLLREPAMFSAIRTMICRASLRPLHRQRISLPGAELAGDDGRSIRSNADLAVGVGAACERKPFQASDEFRLQVGPLAALGFRLATRTPPICLDKPDGQVRRLCSTLLILS